MFMKAPYNLNPDVAKVLARICCFDNQLPQGAPTSPIVSNMICARMDNELQKLAKNVKCKYTRYADDVTFSTTKAKFPDALALVDSSPEDEQIQVGKALEKIIQSNGFEINKQKVRLQRRNERQEVTGLTTNKFPNVKRQYVRQIRAMLHAWEKFGLEAAQAEFWTCYDKKHRADFNKQPCFKRVVKGKIEFLGMVRGKDNLIYRRFLKKYSELDPDFDYSYAGRDFEEGAAITKPLIITEGKTDWKHLKCAFIKLQEAGQFIDLEIDFKDYEDELRMGDNELKNLCTQLSKMNQPQRLICIFDRDNSQVLRGVTIPGQDFKNWGNNVFSFAIPIPAHRQGAEGVCIELYYKDSEIKRTDEDGRRLYLSNEFSQLTGLHKRDSALNCIDLNKIRSSAIGIIDNLVYRKEKNVALPKRLFAEYVLNQNENFDDFDVSEFAKIFDIIATIATF